MLLEELRAGVRRPGALINIKEVAAGLRVSGTPVREALERLAGEGAVVVTGERHGFAAARLRPRELAGHHELIGLLAEHAIRGGRGGRGAPDRRSAEGIDFTDPAAAVEQVIEPLFERSANPVILQEARRLGTVMAPYRRVEPSVIEGWADGLARIIAAERPDRLVAAVRAFTKVRRQFAADIVEAAEL